MEQIITEHANAYFLSEDGIQAYYDEYFATGTNAKNIKWDIFVLINRKGYWDYKIFYPNGVQSIGLNQFVISDRYLEKSRRQELEELLKDKVVIIYDDALSNGSNLFYYFLLCKCAGAKQVIPVVYALNSNFPTEKSYKLMRREAGAVRNKDFWLKNSVDRLVKEFVNSLEYKVLLTNNDINRMSTWQTELFQKHVCPLVMDLPIINHIRGSSEKKISISVEQFERLCQNKSANWRFVENEMKGLKLPIKASYFRYTNTLLEQSYRNLFHDFVVKCKYLKCGNSVHVVFTPFAIVKSVTFKTVYDCFKLFYTGTPYADEVLKGISQDSMVYRELEEDGNLGKALYRAVIFRISDFIGRKFQQYVREVLGLEVEYDWAIMKDNFDESFIETQKEWYQSFEEKAFERVLSQIQEVERIQPITIKGVKIAEKVKPTQELVNCFIRNRIIEKKKDIDASLYVRIYTIETMESELDEYFEFEDMEEKREMLTNTCLLFLETNSFGNFILVSSEDHIVFRGFRYGENSEILLHDDLWFFYAYLTAFYNVVSGTIMSKYDSFMQWLEDFLVKRGYMGVWISEDGFHFLRDYFGKIESGEELADEIGKRRYMLDCDGYGKENEVRANMIREAAHIVKQWGKA